MKFLKYLFITNITMMAVFRKYSAYESSGDLSDFCSYSYIRELIIDQCREIRRKRDTSAITRRKRHGLKRLRLLAKDSSGKILIRSKRGSDDLEYICCPPKLKKAYGKDCLKIYSC